jgi:hypothetical protein
MTGIEFIENVLSDIHWIKVGVVVLLCWAALITGAIAYGIHWLNSEAKDMQEEDGE